MMKRFIFVACAMLLVATGCGVVNNVKKDIPIQDMDSLNEEYIGRTAWTRALLVDIGRPDAIIDRDMQVEIIALDMHWNGAVTVRGPDRKKITHNLNIARPLDSEKYKQKLSQLFWFKKPTYRYRMDLRRHGKRTAKAIFNHELFKGMKSDAALESWGYPDEMKTNEYGDNISEQWIYFDPRQNKKQYIWLVDGVVDKWEE